MRRTLLIDADIVAYVGSATAQRSYNFNGPDEDPFVTADLDEATGIAKERIDMIVNHLKPDDVIVCLSDDFSSFRKNLIDETYKGTRTAERPLQLYEVKDWLRDNYEIAELPHLEADDVMGILATDPSRSDERIIVSEDKDMMTIPGRLYRPQNNIRSDGGLYKQPRILDITEREAWRFHFWQAIVGDATDGYKGAFRVGKKSIYAEAVLEAEDEEEAWEWVIAAHQKAGGDENDALVQARLARILQHSDYEKGRVKLWLPPYSGERE